MDAQEEIFKAIDEFAIKLVEGQHHTADATTTMTTDKENELGEQIHFLCITHPRNKLP